ncbi:phenylacetate--CoA ligase family protein [Maribacter sp. ANRC-HE7]|uniref:Phenylacetate--CoA ligase family protein n=1 Tax=Maribacter aquimaris TaxID=2737171 RepID=A0ABR7V0I3_9FLAO|nr:phenylacetate--CoA ligase family protein [Maribacter aquimaris]MBD0778091.1 phenylacetate--CoA ligase family protein [Maribacter aquimaris]
MMHKLLFKYGVRLRNPSLYDYLSFLKKSDSWSHKRLIAYQTKKCKEFLEFAYKYSSFYKTTFDDLNFKPSEFKDLEQMKLLPTISKTALIRYNSSIHSDYPFKKVFPALTSGTTGESLEFLKNEEWDSSNRAAMFRGYSWYGVHPADKNGYLWGYNIDPKQALRIKWLDRLQNRFRIFSYNTKEIEYFAKNLKGAGYLHGYSSMIYEVAKLVNRSGLKIDHKLKMIKGTSEMIFDAYQEEVTKAFGLKILSEYGSAESGVIAFECPEGNMHIAMENVIVEEEDGEILVTNLLSKSFPIIRYRLGDMIELADKDFKCSCGRAHPVILNIKGRVGVKIIGKSQEFPGRMIYNVIKNLSIEHGIILNYQARQHMKGVVDLYIEQNEENSEGILEKELKKYFKDEIDFNIFYGKNLHNMEEKLNDFITTIG